jgi:phage baseplate assembly protein gpV
MNAFVGTVGFGENGSVNINGTSGEAPVKTASGKVTLGNEDITTKLEAILGPKNYHLEGTTTPDGGATGSGGPGGGGSGVNTGGRPLRKTVRRYRRRKYGKSRRYRRR